MPAQGSTSLSGAGLWTATPASRTTSRETPKRRHLIDVPFLPPINPAIHTTTPTPPHPLLSPQWYVHPPQRSPRARRRASISRPFPRPANTGTVFPPCLVANRRVLGRRLGRRHQPPPVPRLGPRRRPHRHPSPRGRRPEGEARQRPAQQHARGGRRRLQQHHAAPVHGRVARPQG